MHHSPSTPAKRSRLQTIARNARRSFGLLLAAAALVAGNSPARAGGSVSVGDPSNPGALFSAIMAAYAAGNSTITINPGAYVIPMISGKHVWDFESVSNLTINGSNVTISFADATFDQLEFNNCSNLTLNGLTFNAVYPCFSQGAIFNAGSDSNGDYVDVTIDAGYPSDWTNSSHWGTSVGCNVFDATTRYYKPGTGDYAAKFPPTTLNGSARQYRFYGVGSDFLPANHRVVNGDFIAFEGQRGEAGHIGGCSNLTFSNITDTVGFCAFWECGNGLFTIDHCTFTLPNPPAGGTAMGLEGPTGILSLGNSLGLHMTNTIWRGSSDDVVNDDANRNHVGQTSGTTLIYTSGGGWQSGDTLYFYDTNGNYVGQAVTASAAQSDAGYTPPDNTYGSASWQQITLTAPFSAQYKYEVIDITRDNGLGFTMSNDSIQDFRDVGLIVCSVNAVVENCTFDSGTMNAIVCEGFSNNLTIKNNTFSNNGFTNANIEGGRDLGVIQLDNQYYNKGETGQTFLNTLIEGNTFDHNYGLNIAVQNASGTQILNNVFENTHQAIPNVAAYPSGLANGQDPSAVVWIENDTTSTLSGNEVVNAGPYIQHLIETSGTATGTGLVGGAVLFNEAENLAVGAYAGPDPRIMTDPGMSNGAGLIIDATAIGNYMALVYPYVPPGTYDVQIGLKDFNPRGIFQLSIGAEGATGFPNYGPLVDEYQASGQSYPVQDFGNWTSHSTTGKVFQFTVTGKDAGSSGYSVSIDYIRLIPQ